MATSPQELSRKFDRLAADLTFKIPKQGLTASAAIVLAAAKAGANRGAPPGGGQIKMKVGSRGGQPSAVVFGYGFAVLTEYGSYKKPSGWAIYPRKAGKAQARSRAGNTRGLDRKALAAARRLGYAKVILGDGSDFAAAYVTNHPPIKAKPYQQAAAAGTAPKAAAVYDRAVIASLASIF